MPSIEPILRRRHLLVLLLCFIPCYLINIWVVELRRDEALVGTVAREMALSRGFLSTNFQGDHVGIFPHYPALVALCSGLGVPNTLSTRLPGALAVLATALVCAAFTAKRGGRLAGVVAGGMVLSTLASLRAGQRAQSETLLMFWLTCGWLAWYVYGQERKRWGLAWGSAMLFLFLATSAVGARAVAYFYIPFLFLKRPVRGRQRLLQPYHVVALAGFAAMVAFWLLAAPDQPFMPWNAEHARRAHDAEHLAFPVMIALHLKGYLFNRLAFPVKAALYLMPWLPLAWTPFCVAFRWVERRPVLFHYLRTLVGSLFLFVWALPRTSPLLLLPVLPALSIMAGCHFEILIRRYRQPLERYMGALAWLGGAFASAGLLLALCHLGGVVVLVGLPLGVLSWNAAVLAVAVALAVVAARAQRRGTLGYWLRFLLVVCSLRLVVAAILPPWEAWSGNERRQLGSVLAGRLDPGMLHGGHGPVGEDEARPESPDLRSLRPAAPGNEETGKERLGMPVWTVPGLPADERVVFVHRPEEEEGNPSRPALITESFYLGRLVHRVRKLETDLPRGDSTVYVLGGREAPILASRVWTPVSPLLDSRRRNRLVFNWLPGDVCVLRLEVVARDPSSPPNWIRLYRGDAR